MKDKFFLLLLLMYRYNLTWEENSLFIREQAEKLDFSQNELRQFVKMVSE